MRERRCGSVRFVLGFDIRAIEPPTVPIGLFVPQIALGAAQAGRPFGASAAAGQTARFGAYPGDRGPLEGRGTAAFD
ncbi:hypothetical protein G6F59_018792 [Rhizopus arrhizus]|nr:hypothetical protein G6F59_018792 [Rhizopus arrhizus]